MASEQMNIENFLFSTESDLGEKEQKFQNIAAIHELFITQAQRTPDQVAIKFGEQILTYRELNAKSNQLARFLILRHEELTASKLAPDNLIAVYMNRGIEVVIALLAIFKSGAAYLPLDPEYPPERLKFMLEDAQVKIILTQGDLILNFASDQYYCVQVEQIMAFNSLSAANLAIANQPHHLAYVNYTSGTTGKPKGVMNTHRGLLNRLLWSMSTYRLTPQDRLLQIASLGFDISIWEILFPLISGALLVIAETGLQRSILRLAKLINSEGITFLHAVPSLLNALLEQPSFLENRSLAQVVTGGEIVSSVLRKKFLDKMQCKLYIAYGPTEAAISVTHLDCAKDNWGTSIGKAIANTYLYVLDPNLKPVSIGDTGELYIGGANLARGYLNQAELTQERFIINPFIMDSQSPDNTRLYKTGDLVRWLPDGDLEYIGRMDNQIKLRGVRIELEEVEQVMRSYPEILETVVSVCNLNKMDYLVAYFSLREKNVGHYNTKNLKTYLKSVLPDIMIPSYLIKLDSLPLNTNGKIDRKNLPQPVLKDRFCVSNEEI